MANTTIQTNNKLVKYTQEINREWVRQNMFSPYMGEELDLHAWARDALALALPTQLTCRPDCAGLCPQCGANLNDEPDHRHDEAPDNRWAKLSELKFD